MELYCLWLRSIAASHTPCVLRNYERDYGGPRNIAPFPASLCCYWRLSETSFAHPSLTGTTRSGIVCTEYTRQFLRLAWLWRWCPNVSVPNSWSLDPCVNQFPRECLLTIDNSGAHSGPKWASESKRRSQISWCRSRQLVPDTIKELLHEAPSTIGSSRTPLSPVLALNGGWAAMWFIGQWQRKQS